MSKKSSLTRFEAAEPHMGTLFSIKLYAPNRETAQAAFRAAFGRVTQLDDELSDYRPESELMIVCRDAYRAPVVVSTDLFTVLAKAQQLSRETEGAFDVTLGPVIRLWREARKTRVLPSASELLRAQQRSGYENLILSSGERTVSLRIPSMQLDLGAIAKGYAADEALAVLRDRGLTRALVAASGDIAIGDPPEDKPGWSIAIDAKTVALHNTAVSTSGDTEQYVEIAGVRYSHIVNPSTGMGLTQGVSVSVIAPRGIDADSYATALSVLIEQRGMERAMDWAKTRTGTSITIQK